MVSKNIKDGLTFDDVLLIPQYSEVLPHECSVATRFSRNIKINVPIVTAAMDTVTESAMAIALAQEGGIGVIHKNMSIEEQQTQVKKVKRAESGMIMNPITVEEDAPIRLVSELMDKYSISGVVVVDKSKKIVGILTNRDIIFEKNLGRKVREIMTHEKLITAPEGTSLEKAQKILKKYRIEKLPIVDKAGRLKGLITVKDIIKKMEHPNATVDKMGRLRCAAAIGTGKKTEERAAALVEAGVDAIVIDTAHAHSKGVLDLTKKIKKTFSKVELVVGNIGTADAAAELVKLDVDAIG